MVKRTRLLAFLLGATMMVGSTMTVAASGTTGITPTDGTKDVLAPVYNLNITDVVVPTNFGVALNPDGATITTTGTNTSTDQVVSLNYGIVQKSSQDKKVTVAFTVEDKNTGDHTLTLATSEGEVTNAKDDTYVLYLEAVPGTGVKVDSKSPDKDTATAKLGDVVMTPDNDHKIVANGNKFEFVMDKATYVAKSGEKIELGTDDTAVDNNISKKVQVDELGNRCSSVGFTFTGKMNTNTNWSYITNGVKISATYTIEDIYNASEYGLVTVKAPVAANDLSLSQKSTTISNIPENVTLDKVVSISKTDGSEFTLVLGTHYTFASNVLTITRDPQLDTTAKTKFVLTFSNGTTLEIPIVAAS